MKIKSIGIYCGASVGASNTYANEACRLADALLELDLTLVYGGARVGLMGVLAERMLAGGGQVVGVMPEFLVNQEVAHAGLTRLHIVKTMDERKKLINKISDAFILLPGGIGSLDEFFENLTLAQLGLHNKPRGILNTANYYQELLKFLDHAVQESFWNAANRDRVIIEADPNKLLTALLNYHAPVLNRWVVSHVTEE